MEQIGYYWCNHEFKIMQEGNGFSLLQVGYRKDRAIRTRRASVAYDKSLE
jgi:hypothetical protein